MWKYVGLGALVLTFVLCEESVDTKDKWPNEAWSRGMLQSVKVIPDTAHFFWHYIPIPEFTEHIESKQMTLPRESEVKCWTCYTLDTLEVSTNNCNRTLCTGKSISACYKWHVKYGFKKYRTYRGCMDNYTEIDYTNAMCRGTGLPLNETCEWSLCKTDFCNNSAIFNLSLLLLILIMVYWNPPQHMRWPTLD